MQSRISPKSSTHQESVEFLNSPAFSELGLPFSEIVHAGNTLYMSGQIGNLPGTLTLAPGGIEAETWQTLTNVKVSLESHGFSMGNVVKCTVMLADMAEWPAFNAVYTSFFAQPFPVGIPVDRDRSFRFVVTGDSGSS